MKRILFIILSLVLFQPCYVSAQSSSVKPKAGKYYLYYHLEERVYYTLIFNNNGGVKQREVLVFNGVLDTITGQDNSFEADGYYEKNNYGGYTLHLHWRSAGDGEKYLSGDLRRLYKSYNQYRGNAEPNSRFVGIADNADHAASLILKDKEAHKPSDADLFLQLLLSF